MTKPSPPSAMLSAADSPLSQLAAALPVFVVRFKSDRYCEALLKASCISMLLGLGALLAATRMPSFAWLKWIGVMGCAVGFLLALGATATMASVTVLRLRRVDQILLGRLDAMWEEEWRIITGLAPGRFDKLGTRARWLKLHGQLLDRTAARVTLLSVIVTSGATLLSLSIESQAFSPWLSAQSLALLKGAIRLFPVALGFGLAMPALFHHQLAAKLSRVEFIVSEAAYGVQALTPAKSPARESADAARAPLARPITGPA